MLVNSSRCIYIRKASTKPLFCRQMENRIRTMEEVKVAFIYDKSVERECNKLPTMSERSSRVQNLIESFGLLDSTSVRVVKPVSATEEELKSFHDPSYVDLIKRLDDDDDGNEKDTEEERERVGLTYDCPPLEDLHDFIGSIGGATISAAKILSRTRIPYAINWFGGWHHAHRSSAEGFCYVNDIVLGIIELLKKFERVLYIDLDVHHGNGVEGAFEKCKDVLTLSFHKKSPGFYPGSGSIEDVGSGDARYYTMNVPFREGIGNSTYRKLFNGVFKRVYDTFRPSVMVVQCGADVIKGDPIGQCNVTLKTMGDCVKEIIGCKVPTMFLGGGGYNFANCSRYWTYLTSIIAGTELDECEDIPDSSAYFVEFEPTYELKIDASNAKDHNDKDYVKSLIDTIDLYCQKMQQKNDT
ncbi:PREDICTED: histone deacetylase 8-like [Nicrophorus vespilloides]|uniref:Histone deacetylase n=1 Tax=Nicrophorus vespilloides TaxID=110193 RepID=A0ABM1M906_NICVS|nr:PREDICTED: histone deacetylase 8-like [Nicrophorus vespilloides]